MDSKQADFPRTFAALGLSSFLIPLLLIIVYQRSFELGSRVIVYHMLLVSALIAAQIALGILLVSIPPFSQFKGTSYLIAGCWGLLYVFYYFSYLLAFGGQLTVGMVITFPMFLAYAADLNETAAALSVTPALAYLILFFVPAAFVLASILLRNPILEGTRYLRNEISSYSFDSPPLHIKVKLVTIIFVAGFLAGALPFVRPSLVRRSYFYQQEPVVRVFSHSYILGLYLGSSAESRKIRESYPKDVSFNKRNVILIVIDSLRADYLSIYGFQNPITPFLNRLYASGALRKVDLAFSTSSTSFAGILSILRSKSLTSNTPIFP